MGGSIGLVILVLDIFGIWDVYKSSKTMGKKVLWYALILLLPVIGLIAYFVIGRKKPTAA